MSKSELLKVYSEMLKLYLRLKSDEKLSECEVLKIYREYLKLSMKISFNSPSFIEDKDDYKNGNCYCYAMGFNTPRIIGKKYFESCSRTLRHNVGFIHGGYKIALFRSYYDFHFVRENSDSTWSHKKGYCNQIIRLEKLPIILDRDYDYVKTYEIVKPR